VTRILPKRIQRGSKEDFKRIQRGSFQRGFGGELQRGLCIIRDQDPSKEDFKRIQRGSFQRGFGGELQRGLCIIRDQDSSKENPKRIQRGSFQRGFGGSCKEAFAPYMTRILPKVPDVCVSIFPTLAACDDVEQQTLTLTA